MKDKKVFQVLSILGILTTLYGMLNCVELGKQAYEESIKAFSTLSKNISSPNYFVIMFVILSIVSIIIFSYTFLCSKNEKIPEKKGKLVLLVVISLVFSVTIYSQLVGLILLVSLLTVKGVKPKKNAKKDIPKISYSTDKYLPGIKGMFFCFALLAIYFSQLLFNKILPNDVNIVRIVSISFDLLMMILCIAVFRKEIFNGLKKFKDNIKVYAGFCLEKYAKFWILYLIAAVISVLITNNQTSANQSALEDLPLWYLIPAALVYAPIVEETLFRGCLRRFLGKSNILFIIISGAVFGWLHAMSEVGLVNIIATSLPYAVLGSCFAYVYTKTNNITCNMFLHFCHNSIAVIMMLLMRLF